MENDPYPQVSVSVCLNPQALALETCVLSCSGTGATANQILSRQSKSIKTRVDSQSQSNSEQEASGIEG